MTRCTCLSSELPDSQQQILLVLATSSWVNYYFAIFLEPTVFKVIMLVCCTYPAQGRWRTASVVCICATPSEEFHEAESALKLTEARQKSRSSCMSRPAGAELEARVIFF